MDTPIYHKLNELKKEKRIPFHMPGHKRKHIDFLSEMLDMDITEITGYDNLHYPEGMIRESMDGLKEIYGTKESWYLINGSTVGILAAISSCCSMGDGILISRNCHKAVYNAIRLLHLNAHYFSFSISDEYQITESLSQKAEKKLTEILENHKQIKAIVFPSPTYEGVVMDVKKIKEIGERFGIFVIVDEAHGAHFPFHEYFPQSAISSGADLVVQSTHKTLPAMTQTALLHLCSDYLKKERISEMLSIYETSSPSYILMSSAEYAVRYMKENVDKVQEYVDNLKKFRNKCGQLQCIHLIEKKDLKCVDYDNSKLLFSVKNTDINGKELFHQLLEQFHIELEMYDAESGLAMTSVCDEKSDFDALWEAIYEIDQEIFLRLNQNKKDFMNQNVLSNSGKEGDKTEPWISKNKMQITSSIRKNLFPEKIMESWECDEKKKEKIRLENSIGRLAAEFVMLYPPGIPLLVPGEKVEKEIVENIKYYLYNGYNVSGVKKDGIYVVVIS